MDNQNQSKLKLRICRMFSSSFGSCRSKNITDVVQRSLPSPSTAVQVPISPKAKPEPFTGRRKKLSQVVVETVEQNCSSSKDRIFRRRRRKIRPSRLKKKETFDAYYEFFSSDDDEEEDDDRTTLFSSRSLSSDSSDSFLRNRAGNQRRRKERRSRTVSAATAAAAEGDRKVKESTAVAKRSSDPYRDFRNSMVEMIVEKKIFAAGELENLLQAFLGLNSSRHHPVILQVYTDILETLFSDHHNHRRRC